MRVISGLSGNEIYCLNMMGLGAGDLVVGNSVYSLGVAGSVGSALRTLAGGEVEAVTNIIRDGRLSAYQRMLSEAKKRHACGIISVSSTVVHHGDNVEFLAIGSAVHSTQPGDSQAFCSASADGQELYCQSDAGFEPVEFVFGNVVYALGVGRLITAGFRSFARGEIKEMSDMLNAIRHLAIERIAAEASAVGANAVLGIHTSVRPIAGAQEMIMSGTACRTPHLLVRDGQGSHYQRSDKPGNVESGARRHLAAATRPWRVRVLRGRRRQLQRQCEGTGAG